MLGDSSTLNLPGVCLELGEHSLRNHTKPMDFWGGGDPPRTDIWNSTFANLLFLPKILLPKNMREQKTFLGIAIRITTSKNHPHRSWLAEKNEKYTREVLTAGSSEKQPLFQGNIPTQVNPSIFRWTSRSTFGGWEIPIDWGGGVRGCLASSVPSRCKMVPPCWKLKNE